MYSAYKLNKQGHNIQSWHTPFPIWNQSVFPCPVLTIASWPAYRFLRRQLRWSGIPISLRIVHSLLWSTVKGFSAVNEAELMFFWLWKVKVKSLSCVRLFATPWTVAYEVPPSMEFSRREYWSRLPFPSPKDLPDPRAYSLKHFLAKSLWSYGLAAINLLHNWHFLPHLDSRNLIPLYYFKNYVWS